MNILMTGATGLIGRHFITRYSEHDYTVLVRSKKRAAALLPASVQAIEALSELDSLDGFDAVINLVGEPIVGKRWTARQKNEICHSRWDVTRQLADMIVASEAPPGVFVSGSAIGYYGDQGDAGIDEGAKPGSGFPSQVCSTWESMAHAADGATRLVLLRTGIVLSPEGGALQKMLLPFRMGLGGAIAGGRQYMSWIHIEDMVQAMAYLLEHSDCSGAFNLTAPEPVSNRAFTQTLGRVLRRPTWFAVPRAVLSASMGEAACLLLESQKVMPKRLSESGYVFSHPQLQGALSNLLER